MSPSLKILNFMDPVMNFLKIFIILKFKCNPSISMKIIKWIYKEYFLSLYFHELSNMKFMKNIFLPGYFLVSKFVNFFKEGFLRAYNLFF